MIQRLTKKQINPVLRFLTGFNRISLPKGFTLIELLVVIAIIGLLATIVLVSFTEVRTSGKDTAVKANMNQMRLAAEIEYNVSGDYSGVSDRDDFTAAKDAAEGAGADFGDGDANIKFSGDGEAYCFQALLPGGENWCVDNVGFVGEASGCTGENFSCR